MDMASYLLFAFCYLYDLMEQFLHSYPFFGYGRYDGCAEECAELLGVELVAAVAELVVHVEGYDHGHVHVDELGGEIEVALQVAGVDDVDDDVGVLLYDVFSHVELFGRVCGERIGARQVDEGEVIPLEVE